jgi:hypothetical protein
VEEGAFEGVDARVVGEFPGVEMADGIQEDVEFFFVYLELSISGPACTAWFVTYPVLLQIAHSDLPLALVAKPLGPFDSMLRPNVLVDMVFARNTLPVLSDLVPLCKLLRPLGVWLEIRLVDVGWDIAPHTRICILKPSPSLDSESAPRSFIFGKGIIPGPHFYHRSVDSAPAALPGVECLP